MILLDTLFKTLFKLLFSSFCFIVGANIIFVSDGYDSFIVLIAYQKYLISIVSKISLHILINLM